LEQTQRTLSDEQVAHGKTCEALSSKTLECTQLSQQVLDLQERIAAEERHRLSLEHFRESAREQRDQDLRKHEQQVQYLQAELRSVNETLAAKRQESIHTLQENARLLGELSRSQGDLRLAQEEMRSLRPLKDELGFAQRRTEELSRRLVEQDAVVQQLRSSKEQLQVNFDELLTTKQQLELALATARSSVAAQEQVVASMLERLGSMTVGADRATINSDDGTSRPATMKGKT
jgi:chromosome segregation ATPase